MNIKKIVLCASLSTLCAGGADAGILLDIYAGATIGGGAATVFADNNVNTEAAQSYGAIFGIDIPLLRIEAEYNYLNDSGAAMHLGIINAYLKMPSTVIIPYAGVGAGSIFGGSADEIDIKTTAAYQGTLGVTFDMPVLPMKFDIEGRAIYAPDIYDIAGTKPDLLHYDARLKLRYVF